MHLLVLGTFWLEKMIADLETRIGLNAASGAGCFLTGGPSRTGGSQGSLNAPCGAGCYLT